MDRTTLDTHISRQNPLVGRRQIAPKQSWTRWIEGPRGEALLINPAPGRTYTKECWPPVGRGRGESLTSPRRIQAKIRAGRVVELRSQGFTWASIGRQVGLSTSGAYRAAKRAIDRLDWDMRRREALKRQK